MHSEPKRMPGQLTGEESREQRVEQFLQRMHLPVRPDIQQVDDFVTLLKSRGADLLFLAGKTVNREIGSSRRIALFGAARVWREKHQLLLHNAGALLEQPEKDALDRVSKELISTLVD